MIPYGRQSIDPADIAAVVAVLESDWLTQGPAVAQFEAAVAGYCGARGAVAVSSGTAALHLACRAAGLGPGDRLWTSPISFVASANCALYCGGDVDFVDIDPGSANLSVDALARKLETAERDGRLPSVVLPVHYAGQACDMAAIAALADRYGFTVIEDAAHAIGGCYRDHPIGSCRYAAMTVFSFHPVKIITAGEGGMVTTRDGRLRERVAALREHGIRREPAAATGAGGWYYEQTELGYNYRMSDIHAALGASQLRRIDGLVARRRALAARYDAALDALPLTPLHRDDRVASAHHLYPVRLHGGAATRRRLYDRLRAAGIGAQVHYIPLHLHPFYRARGFAVGDYPAAEAYYAATLSLPLYPDLGDADQDRVIAILRAELGSA